MDKNTIEKHAKALMTAHGVGFMTFRWKRSKKGIASCHWYATTGDNGQTVYVPTEIRFSEVWITHLTEEKIHEVMLHEIAHAKAPGDGHGRKWAAECRKLGIEPNRCQTDLPSAPKGKVEGYCPVCQRGVANLHRLPLRLKWCNSCFNDGSIPKTLPLGQGIKWFKEGVRVYNRDMPARYRAEWDRKQVRESLV